MNNKKSIITLLLLVAIIGIVGLTIAYFSNEATIENEFNTNSYGTTVEEEFVSPTNWTPGTQTDKTLTVTNSGSVDEAVRVSYTETWTSENSNTEGDLPLTQNGNRAALIHFINEDDWTLSNGYYYYNYKLAPSETTSELLDYVTFNPAITNDDDCSTVTSNGTTTITCDSTGDGYDGATYKLTFTIETVQYDKYNEAWGLNNSVTIAAEKPVPASQYLANNATNPANTEYNATTKGNMFTFTHGEGANAVTDYRYIGDAPNNYVYFNCDTPQEGVEYNYDNSCEIWRIIGVFDVDDGNGNVEQSVKLVRGKEFASTMAFNSSYNNDWTISPINTFLNGDYYNRQGDASTYGLKASARGMIDNAVYYLGAVSFYTNFGTAEIVYASERGNKVCGSCNSDNTKLTWTGKVGLMYPSDEYMVYGNGVDTTCYDDPYNCSGTAQTGWIFKSNSLEGQTLLTGTWLLSSATSSNYALYAGSEGRLKYYYEANSRSGVRPVVYLKSSVQIDGGTGEVGNPYILK